MPCIHPDCDSDAARIDVLPAGIVAESHRMHAPDSRAFRCRGCGCVWCDDGTGAPYFLGWFDIPDSSRGFVAATDHERMTTRVRR
jgi:hypothetical protein